MFPETGLPFGPRTITLAVMSASSVFAFEAALVPRETALFVSVTCGWGPLCSGA